MFFGEIRKMFRILCSRSVKKNSVFYGIRSVLRVSYSPSPFHILGDLRYKQLLEKNMIFLNFSEILHE